MIVYEPFWDTIRSKNISTYMLINQYGISSSTIDRLRKNETITTTTLDRLCSALACDPDEILTYTEDS